MIYLCVYIILYAWVRVYLVRQNKGELNRDDVMVFIGENLLLDIIAINIKTNKVKLGCEFYPTIT